MRGSKFLQEFLTLKGDKEFKIQKKLREKEKEPSNISAQKTATGNVDASGSANIWKFSYKMPEFISNYTAINKNIKAASLVFAEQVKEVSETVSQLSKYYEVLSTMYQDLDIKNMYQIHRFMSDILSVWGDTYKEQGQIMEDKFSNFFLYHSHEDIPLRDLVKKRFIIKENFVKSEIKLKEKKEKLIKTKEYDKWELDSEGLNKISQLKADVKLAKKYILPVDTKVVEDRRYLLNYFSNQVKNQVVDM